MNRSETTQISNICSELYAQHGGDIFLSGESFFNAAVTQGMAQRDALQLRLMLDSSNLGLLLAQRSDAYEEYACALAMVVEEGGLHAELAARLIDAMVHPLGVKIKLAGRPKTCIVPAEKSEMASVRMRAVMQSEKPECAFYEEDAHTPFSDEGYGWAEYCVAQGLGKEFPDAALIFMESAAKQGFVPAVRRLGVMLYEQYRDSNGKNGNLQKAMDYLTVAGAGSDELARKALVSLLQERKVCRAQTMDLLFMSIIMLVLNLVLTFFVEGALPLAIFILGNLILLGVLAFTVFRVFGTLRNEQWIIRLLLALWVVECIFLLM